MSKDLSDLGDECMKEDVYQDFKKKIKFKSLNFFFSYYRNFLGP